MLASQIPSACACCLARRRFLAGCAGCAAAFGLTTAARAADAPAVAAPAPGRARVRLVFTHTPSTGPIWPNIGYDFGKRKKELTQALTAACPELDLLPVTIMSDGQAKEMLAADKDIDGYLVYMLGLWTRAPQTIAAAGKPAIFADDLYGGSGEYLIANAAARRANRKVVGVSSSRVEDVAAAANTLALLKQPGATVDGWLAACRQTVTKACAPMGDMACPDDPVKAIAVGQCIEKLKKCRILDVGARNNVLPKAIAGTFGTEVVMVDFKELHDAHQRADAAQAEKWADRWLKEARKTIEPSKLEIVNSAKMYLAELELLKKYDAHGITINCLGGFYGGHIKGYPCLGFRQLNDDGRVGACEADLVSTITMLAGTTLTGRPGFISDPVIDTSKHQIIYAHCVAPTKVTGPDGAMCPFDLRDHSEDRKGAVVRSILPVGRMTTTVEFHPARKQLLMHQGKAVDNIDEDKACRTKLAVDVKGDIDKLQAEWDQWGWHRVTFYGDLKAPLAELATALGFKVIEEA